MKDCSRCGAVVDGLRCPKCGYAEPGAPAVSMDSLRHTCAHEDRGQRCANPGTMTLNTLGTRGAGPHDGPWFCAEHFPPFRGWGMSGKPEPRPEPSTADLTDTQWYAVCKFFPGVAARAKRRMVPVGPDEPLDSKVSRGPMFGGALPAVDFEAIAERQAIEQEGRP